MAEEAGQLCGPRAVSLRHSGVKSSMIQRNRKLSRHSRLRNQCGNMLGVCVAFMFIIVALALFSLSFVRTLGAKQEQQTAIEAAALAAAKALARITIEDANFGFIALSDFAPVGKGTRAGDNYFLPVQGINTLLGTVRADMIVADRLNDPIMKELSKRDYQYAIKAKDALVEALKQATDVDGTATDIDGNMVSPYTEAIAAYKANVVRMTGAESRLVDGSLKLTLGCIKDLPTSTPIPKPAGYASVTDDQIENDRYKSYMNMKYDNYDFIFAAVGDNPRLVDQKRFQKTLTDLPYFIPSIVKCEADEQFTETSSTGQTKKWKVHAVACAEPACPSDALPSPGALVLSFPDGALDAAEFSQPGNLLSLGGIIYVPTDDVQSPLQGDFPLTPLSDLTVPIINNENPPFGQMASLAVYDWVRRTRTNINVEALINMLSQPLNTTGGAGSHVYRFNRDGTIKYSIVPALPDLATSHKQIRAITGLARQNANGDSYDIVLRDYVYQPGRILGGIHAGEPLGVIPSPPEFQTTISFDMMQPAFADASSMGNSLEENPAALSNFPVGPGGGAPRPFGDQSGVAVEMRFRRR